MEKNAIEINTEYKENKKIQKLKEKHLEKIEKHKVSQEQKMKLAREKKKADISASFDRKMKIWNNKQQKTLDRNMRKTQGKDPLKKNAKKIISVAWLKKRVFANFQYCFRYDEQDKNWYVIPIDKPHEKRLWNKWTDAWHFFPKYNFPHMIFNLDNLRPQTKHWNRMQLDGVWTYKNEIIIRLWKVKFEQLEKLAYNKSLKQKAIKDQSSRSYWDGLDVKWKSERKKRESQMNSKGSLYKWK